MSGELNRVGIIIKTKKIIRASYFWMTNPFMKFPNTNLNFILNGRADKPNAICPFNFFKVRGPKKHGGGGYIVIVSIHLSVHALCYLLLIQPNFSWVSLAYTIKWSVQEHLLLVLPSGPWGGVKSCKLCGDLRWHTLNCEILKSLFFVCWFDLILYVPSTTFQLNRDGSPWVEPVLS